MERTVFGAREDEVEAALGACAEVDSLLKVNPRAEAAALLALLDRRSSICTNRVGRNLEERNISEGQAGRGPCRGVFQSSLQTAGLMAGAPASDGSTFASLLAHLGPETATLPRAAGIGTLAALRAATPQALLP